ncbi:MAG: homocysteine S-methyltransferase family protein [Clostridia bacterium]|nr:homocysteine S-methyltransferase family protein [Clostridia bacterium]
MNRKEFREWALEYIRLLDGSTGVALALTKGMSGSDVPEKFIMENPESIISLQSEYIENGSEIILTPTLGSTAPMLLAHGLTDAEKITTTLCSLSKQAAKENAYVAGELGPTGKFLSPMGDLSFDEMVDIFKEQVSYSLRENVDLFILETFIDLQEARCAVIAIRELCDLPIIASMTFSNSMTLSGNSPECVAIALEAAGADAVGANCSTGPIEIAEVIKKMSTVTNLPLFAKPNAGLPKIIDGKTVFPMGPAEFAEECKHLIEAGVTLIGGCCGTLPEHIKLLNEFVRPMAPIKRQKVTDTYVSSPTKAVKLNSDKFISIGERINPTSKKALAVDLVAGNIQPVIDLAIEQDMAGADIVDINISAAKVDEKNIMAKIASELPVFCPAPLCFDSPNTEVMEKALRTYCGRAIINSASADSDRMEDMIKLAAKYGAVIILLPFTGKAELTADDRKEGLKRLTDCCEKYGVKKDRMLVDGVVMAISTNTVSALNTLEFIRWCTDNGYLTTGGVSNISFGLPEKSKINEVFLTQMISAGLTTGIVHVNKETKAIINASYLLSGKDEWCMNWIEEMG